MATASLTSPETATERLGQARIFAQYGVWYDALRVASELLTANPNDVEAKAFYDSLIQRLKDEAAQTAAQTSSLSLSLWHELKPLIGARDNAAARAAISRNPVGARALYRELLFDAVDSRLYKNTLIADGLMQLLLAQADPDSAALEAKFRDWAKEFQLGEGFTRGAEGMEGFLYLYLAAEPTNIKNQKVPAGAKPLTSRVVTEAALEAAEEIGNDLGIASSSGNLAYYALQERRGADMLPLLERAGAIWKKWEHPAGMATAAYFTGESYALSENWQEAARDYRRAADLALGLPQLRQIRMASLAALVWSLRTLATRKACSRPCWLRSMRNRKKSTSLSIRRPIAKTSRTWQICR